MEYVYNSRIKSIVTHKDFSNKLDENSFVNGKSQFAE